MGRIVGGAVRRGRIEGMSLPNLTGRTAVITGASRGIGAGLAAVFHAHGMHLALCSRSEIDVDSLLALSTGSDSGARVGQIHTAQLDVGDESAIESFADAAFERFGAVDLWINNAGVLEPVAPLRNLELNDFQRHLEINLIGVFLGTRAYVRRHRRRYEAAGAAQDATLINISSGAAWGGYAGWSAYCAGKAGVDRLTESVQLEEAETGLRAFAVAPGVVDTAMQELIRSCPPERFPMVKKFHQMKQEGAFNSPEFVAWHILDYAFNPSARPDSVTVRIPAE
jgi:benzil reductase ((S)-benzoin forming)